MEASFLKWFVVNGVYIRPAKLSLLQLSFGSRRTAGDWELHVSDQPMKSIPIKMAHHCTSIIQKRCGCTATAALIHANHQNWQLQEIQKIYSRWRCCICRRHKSHRISPDNTSYIRQQRLQYRRQFIRDQKAFQVQIWLGDQLDLVRQRLQKPIARQTCAAAFSKKLFHLRITNDFARFDIFRRSQGLCRRVTSNIVLLGVKNTHQTVIDTVSWGVTNNVDVLDTHEADAGSPAVHLHHLLHPPSACRLRRTSLSIVLFRPDKHWKTHAIDLHRVIVQFPDLIQIHACSVFSLLLATLAISCITIHNWGSVFIVILSGQCLFFLFCCHSSFVQLQICKA